MTTTVAHSWHMTVRHLRFLSRQPWLISISLVQPIIWLLLFGQLFKRITEIPGFGSTSYITFLTPGVVVMTALFSGGWAGMGMLSDLDRGVTDRLLVSPVRRGAITSGMLAYQGIVSLAQTVIIVALGLAAGARFDGGAAGVAVLIAVAALVSLAFASLSIGLSLILRKEESVIAAVQFVALPLTFLGAGFIDERLMPGWIQTVSHYNPMNWAVLAGRSALGGGADLGLVASRGGWLLAFTVACALFATFAFRSYQRSV
jgi:ABC-2 type transport system permease protein